MRSKYECLAAWYEEGSQLPPLKSGPPSNLGPPSNSGLQALPLAS